MKERPILFSAPMVRAILAGTKTQTRRVVKPQPHGENGVTDCICRYADGPGWLAMGRDQLPSGEPLWQCPYGQPGDRLWVRETFMDLGMVTLYRADPDDSKEAALIAPGQPWKPSIHIPRGLSRITLEITEVRVERLQDISADDAMAEGIVMLGDDQGFGLPAGEHFHYTDPRISYWSLWDAINGAGSVEANPWVWAVSFNTNINGA